MGFTNPCTQRLFLDRPFTSERMPTTLGKGKYPVQGLIFCSTISPDTLRSAHCTCHLPYVSHSKLGQAQTTLLLHVLCCPVTESVGNSCLR